MSDVTKKVTAGRGQSTAFAGGFFNYENINSYSYNLMPGGNATLGAQTQTVFGHISTVDFAPVRNSPSSGIGLWWVASRVSSRD